MNTSTIQWRTRTRTFMTSITNMSIDRMIH